MRPLHALVAAERAEAAVARLSVDETVVTLYNPSNPNTLLQEPLPAPLHLGDGQREELEAALDLFDQAFERERLPLTGGLARATSRAMGILQRNHAPLSLTAEDADILVNSLAHEYQQEELTELMMDLSDSSRTPYYLATAAEEAQRALASPPRSPARAKRPARAYKYNKTSVLDTPETVLDLSLDLDQVKP
jgi:hypothetical protein